MSIRKSAIIGGVIGAIALPLVAVFAEAAGGPLGFDLLGLAIVGVIGAGMGFGSVNWWLSTSDPDRGEKHQRVTEEQRKQGITPDASDGMLSL